VRLLREKNRSQQKNKQWRQYRGTLKEGKEWRENKERFWKRW
jgi:hypothetical protein